MTPSLRVARLAGNFVTGGERLGSVWLHSGPFSERLDGFLTCPQRDPREGSGAALARRSVQLLRV